MRIYVALIFSPRPQLWVTNRRGSDNRRQVSLAFCSSCVVVGFSFSGFSLNPAYVPPGSAHLLIKGADSFSCLGWRAHICIFVEAKSFLMTSWDSLPDKTENVEEKRTRERLKRRLIGVHDVVSRATNVAANGEARTDELSLRTRWSSTMIDENDLADDYVYWRRGKGPTSSFMT